ncbi:hypothetical protein SDC9_32269 [bioreactor metagenome]|jgi:hypothetical protein|uniref:Uncharacterized protein n=1 Tax=bioreactor metagenome TaxID=1076179 RepID=A0A644V4M1_9ZZZZ
MICQPDGFTADQLALLLYDVISHGGELSSKEHYCKNRTLYPVKMEHSFSSLYILLHCLK